MLTVKSQCKALLELSESMRHEQVSQVKLLTEIIMPPAKKSATARKAAPAAKVAVPAKRAAPAAKVAVPAKKTASTKKAAAPTKKAVAVKAAPQVTITLRQIAAELAEGHDLPKKQAESVLGGLVALTTQHLKNGDKIRLTGLGILQVRARPARMGRNPATGESIQIAASKNIAFRPAKELKEAV
jgi:DNA-binding protein HU-beta